MAEAAQRESLAEGGAEPPGGHQPYIPDSATIPEFTWSAVLVGAVLGIIFGASSLYLLLKVGMTVSASVPIAVLSITLFRVFSKSFGVRRATILENNIVQTTGSAGESIAFGVGVTMPALLLLGFEMDIGPGDDRLGPGRRAGHIDDDPAAAGVHRQAARQACLPGGNGVCRSADRRRERRLDGADGFHRLRHRRGSQVSARMPAGFGPTSRRSNCIARRPTGQGRLERGGDQRRVGAGVARASAI